MNTFFCEECGDDYSIPGISPEVALAIHKDQHFMDRVRPLVGIGAAVMIQAFVQWAVYGCGGCSALDFGGCSREEYHNCNHKAFHDNFLSMKE